jgi:hypothetical protein
VTGADSTPAALPAETVERLARLVHEDYLRRHPGFAAGAPGYRDKQPPSLHDWDQLPEGLRASNRAQVADIVAKVVQLGYRLLPANDPAACQLELSTEEVERLAQAEHRRFVAERLAAGWRLGPRRLPEEQESPDLVEWEDLSEELRDLDRDAVRLIPRLLTAAGLGVTRIKC